MKSSSGYEIYHNTLSSCLNEVEDYIQSKGYQVGDYFPLINHVSYGQTERTQLEMIKNGKVANTLAIQIYRMESGRYELNCYPVRKFSGGGSVNYYDLQDLKNKEYILEEKISKLIDSQPDGWKIDKAELYSELEMVRKNISLLNQEKFETGGGVKSYYIVTFGFEGDDGEYELHDSKPIFAENEDEAGEILRDQFWSYEGIRPDIQQINKAYKTGGSTDEGIDLFEDYENIPPQVMEILNKYEESFMDGDYKGLEQAHDELWEIGYTFEAYLDGVAYDLRPVGTKGKTSEEFATGGGIKNLKVGDKYKFKFDNKIYEVVAIEDHLIHLHNTQGLWWDNRKATISVMAKWLKNKSMVKAMATGGGLETYKDLSKETPLVINDSSAKLGKVPEIDLIKTGKVIDSPAIRNSKDCYEIFKKFWNENNIEIVEQLNVLFLSKANKPLGIYQHSKGGIDGTTLDIEIISAMAVKSLAKGVIIAHNHPSGALVPSEADKQMTQKLFNALKLFQIGLVDSMIITNNGYFSFADQGMMP